MFRYYIITLIVGSILLSATPAQALTCYPYTLPKMYHKAKHVFSGKVLKKQGTDITLSIDKRWKGEHAPRIKLKQGSYTKHTFLPNESYLVFAYYNRNDGETYAEPYGCTLTRRLGEAAPFVTALDSFSKKQAWPKYVKQ